GNVGHLVHEVLKRTGHSNPMDIWPIGWVPIPSYLLRQPETGFRSAKLIKDTTEAKIDFHERYWKNVSDSGTKPFISTRALAWFNNSGANTRTRGEGEAAAAKESRKDTEHSDLGMRDRVKKVAVFGNKKLGVFVMKR
ncbi:hypothetical protein M378DRAFT_77152, partial [Amanita muscaria Koide BX008]